MKIPFKFQEIDSMLQGDYESKFKAALKKIKAKATSPETAIEVFLNQEHVFSDETSPILIAGKISGPWLKWVKDKVKANKKMTLMGKGYVETDENGNDKLTIMKLKGNIKIDKFKKEAKTLLKKVKLAAIDIVEDFGTEENGQATDVAGPSEESTETTPPVDDATAVKEILVKISKLNKSIDLKNGLQESDLQYATEMKKAIQEFASLLKKASGTVRKEFGPQFIKTKALYAKLDEEIKKLQADDDALEAALNDTLGGDDEEDSTQGEQASSQEESAYAGMPEANNRQEAIDKSKELHKAITELEKTMGLHELV